jgi:hypothetical protein
VAINYDCGNMGYSIDYWHNSHDLVKGWRIMKRLGNYLSLGLWLFACSWLIFGIKVNIVDTIFTIVLVGLLYVIIKLWND